MVDNMCSYAKNDILKKSVKTVLSYFFYSLLLKYISRNTHKAAHSSGVAVIFLASLGDFIVFCSAAEKISKSKKITLICKQNNGVAEFANITRLFDDIIEVDIDGFRRVKNIKLLNKIEADTVFCAPLGRHALPDIYACSVRANHRIFPDTDLDCSLKSVKKRIDRHADKLIPINQSLEMQRYEEFLSAAGFADEKITTFLLDIPLKKREKILAIFPGAGGGKQKQWGYNNFAYVVKSLVKKSLIRNVVILGTNDDKECCDKLYNVLNGLCDITNLCGKTQIVELIDVLSSCCLVLSNDSGGAHLSMACSTPTIIICGMWQYGRFYPNCRLDKKHCAVMADKNFAQSCRSSFPLCRSECAACIEAVCCDEVVKCSEKILQERSA